MDEKAAKRKKHTTTVSDVTEKNALKHDAVRVYAIRSHSLNKEREKKRRTHHASWEGRKKTEETRCLCRVLQQPMPVRASGTSRRRDGGGQEFDTQSFDDGFTANAATNTGSGKKKTNTKGLSAFRGNDSASFSSSVSHLINGTIDFRVGFKVLQLNEKSNSNVGEMFVHLQDAELDKLYANKIIKRVDVLFGNEALGWRYAPFVATFQTELKGVDVLIKMRFGRVASTR